VGIFEPQVWENSRKLSETDTVRTYRMVSRPALKTGANTIFQGNENKIAVPPYHGRPMIFGTNIEKKCNKITFYHKKIHILCTVRPFTVLKNSY
jgi:hypothetical protein